MRRKRKQIKKTLQKEKRKKGHRVDVDAIGFKAKQFELRFDFDQPFYLPVEE